MSVLHLLFGLSDSHRVTWADVWQNLGLSTAGNVLGGLGLISLTHTAHVKSARS